MCLNYDDRSWSYSQSTIAFIDITIADNRRAVKGEIVQHWTCTQCAQNGEQQPDPAEHVQDQQVDHGLVSGYVYYSF